MSLLTKDVIAGFVPSLVLAILCLWNKKKHSAAIPNTPTADPTPTPALVPAEKPGFEPRLVSVVGFLADEFAADADWFEKDVEMNVDDAKGMVDEDADVGAIMDVGRELTLKL